MKSKLILCLALVLSGSLFGCSAMPKPHRESDASEWFPTIGIPATLDDYQRQEILKKCGVKDARQIWIRTLDFDQDSQEDCVVTIALPEDVGPNWNNNRSVTYVFRGGNVGAFGFQWENATLWFSLVTYEGQEHVRYGDSETIRQFSLFRRNEKWCVDIRENEYGNDGGEASARLMKFKQSKSWTLYPSEITPAKVEYP